MNAPTWKEKLRYRIDRFFQSGFMLQLVIAGLAVLAVFIFFVALAEIFQLQPGSDFDTENTGQFWPSVRFWWVMTHTLETYWIEQSFWEQSISIILTLFNLLVFAAVVGLVGTKIQTRLENMRRGTSRAIEDDHYVIIGWSEKVVPIIRELYAGLEKGKRVFAIISEHPIDDIESEIRKSVGRKKHLRFVIRQGSATDINDLQLVSIQNAKAVIILRQPSIDEDGDSYIVKTIMAVEHLVRTSRVDRDSVPYIIAEMERPESEVLAVAAANGCPLSLVQPTDALGKIILQTARQAGLVQVYDELLEHHKCDVHAAPASTYPDLIGMPWDKLVFSFPSAIPIGVLREGKSILAPNASDANFSLSRTDDIYFIALDSDNLHSDDADVVIPDVILPPNSLSAPLSNISNLLLLGYNEKALPLITEYNSYAKAAKQLFKLTILSPSTDVSEGLSTSKFDSIELTIVQDDYVHPGVLERTGPELFDTIIILSEAGEGESWEDADTRVIMTLLLLRTLRRSAEERGRSYPSFHQIVGEILHVSNKELTESTQTVRDVIISQTLVSKMIAQICRDPKIEAALQDIFDEEGAEIYLKPASYYTEKDEVSFAELLAASLKRGEIAIGVDASKTSFPDSYDIVLNPKKTDKFSISDLTRIVVVSEKED
jgi:Castor and Pollux protein voltage-gated ion channel component